MITAIVSAMGRPFDWGAASLAATRLGPVPPDPAWHGIAIAILSSKAVASSAVFPLRECPTAAIRRESMARSVTRKSMHRW